MEEETKSGWVVQVEEYMVTVGTSCMELSTMKKEEINLIVYQWDKTRWRAELEGKDTLKIYEAKKKIEEEGLYSSPFSLAILFREEWKCVQCVTRMPRRR